jgi:PPOX class probable F420-dependent enzyme
VRLTADALEQLLQRWPVARLATVTAAGAPHLVPVVFVAHDGVVYSPIDGKRKSAGTLARVANVSATGRASLLLDHYTDDWHRLWWVRLDGNAWIERDGRVLEGARGLLRAKYPQYASVPVFTDEPAAIALRWDRVTAWAQSGMPVDVGAASGRARRRPRSRPGAAPTAPQP